VGGSAEGESVVVRAQELSGEIWEARRARWDDRTLAMIAFVEIRVHVGLFHWGRRR
jgi:hypothetical protein